MFAALLHGELHHLLLTFVQYVVMLPTLSYTLPVYAFCNLHDLSWGTKGLNADPTKRTMGTLDGKGGGLRRTGREDIKDKRAAFLAQMNLVAPNSGGAGAGTRPRLQNPVTSSATRGRVAKNTLLKKLFSSHAQVEKALQKEAVKKAKQNTETVFKEFRTFVLLIWIAVNVALVFTVQFFDKEGEVFMKWLVIVVSAINLFRFCGSVVFLLVRMFRGLRQKLCPRGQAAPRMKLHSN
jgi:hypothetical protein